MNDVTTFDPDALKKRVAESVQAQFASLIPPAAWEALVKQHIDQFMKVDFPALVKQLAKEEMTARIKEEFTKPQWQHQWNGQHKTASDMVRTLVRENAPQLVEAMFSGMIQSCLEHLRQQTRQY